MYCTVQLGSFLCTKISNAFSGLNNLKTLEIRACDSEEIEEGGFNGLHNLKELRLIGTYFPLTVNLFRELNNLEVFKLFLRDFVLIEPDIFRHHLRSLKTLDMFENTWLKDLDESSFSGLNNLNELDLGNCQIEHFEASAFNGLHSLKKLDLNSNPIRELKANMFSELINLEKLDLGCCQIEQIEAGSFNGLQSLKELVSERNPIKKIKANTFSGLNYLEQLDLSYCRIKNIEEGAFNGLQSLKKLDLNSNPYIFEFENATFSELNNLDQIEIIQ